MKRYLLYLNLKSEKIKNHWFGEFKRKKKRLRCLRESEKKKWEPNWRKGRFSRESNKLEEDSGRKCIFRELEERGEVVLLGHMGILSSFSRSRNKNQWEEIPEENNGGF